MENLATAVLCHSPPRSGIGERFGRPLGHGRLRVRRAIELLKEDAAHRGIHREKEAVPKVVSLDSVRGLLRSPTEMEVARGFPHRSPIFRLRTFIFDGLKSSIIKMSWNNLWLRGLEVRLADLSEPLPSLTIANHRRSG